MMGRAPRGGVVLLAIVTVGLLVAPAFASARGRPAAPILSATSPRSPGDTDRPRVLGGADAGTTVRLYEDVGCSGPPAATGSASQLGWPGILLEVAPDDATSIRATAIGRSGRTSACSPAIRYVEDSKPPDTAIGTHPRRQSADSSPAFGFSSSERRSSFGCSLDRSAFAPCSRGQVYDGLADGRHSFRVRAIDRAGNVDPTAALFRWTIDTEQPETTIDAGPSGESVDPTPEFTFSASERGARFECSLDGSTPQACASPQSYPAVAPGSHHFAVRAIDAAGNVESTPARTAFTLRADTPPNILLVITDDQPIDTMQVMPNARAYFGTGGTEFTRGYDVEPLCCPSRASIFSGKYPHNHGIFINDGTGFDATETWVRELHDRGYFTGVIGKYLNAVQTRDAPNFDYRVPINPHDATDEQAQLEADSTEFLDRAEADDGRPWALVYSTESPHTPWNVEPEEPSPLPDYDPPPSVGETDLSDKNPAVADRAALRPPGSDPVFTTDFQRTGMMHELQAVDEGLGKLFANVETRGEELGTLSFFISDNGWLWGQHQVFSKVWPYTESVQVPYFVRWPGHVTAGTTSSSLVANIDIAPTIFEATDIPAAYPVDGRSLLGSEPRQWLLLELPTDQAGMPPWSSYLTADRQYIEWGDGFVEDYDLNADPWQLEASNETDSDIADALAAARECVGSECP